MNILFIRKAFLGNQGDAATHYLPATLSKDGHDVTVITLAGGQINFIQKAGVQVIESTKKEWISTIRNVVQYIHPEIVHVFIHQGCGLYPVILKSKTCPKFVLDIRSPLLYSGPSLYIRQVLYSLNALPYDLITAHSLGSARTIIPYAIYKGIHWVPPGIDFNIVPGLALFNDVSSAPLRLVYTGSLNRLRKVPVMVSAVLNAAKTTPLTLDIFGNGEDSSIIEQMTRHVSPSIQLKGNYPREELFNRLLDYDIGLSYVPRALYDPAPPLKTLEYLALGLPTIATRTAGNAMIIQDGVNGLLADEDESSFAQAILKLAQNPGIRRRLAAQSRDSVLKYDWNTIIKDHLLPAYQQAMMNR